MRSLRWLSYLFLGLLITMPLMANKGCNEALSEAERQKIESAENDDSDDDDEIPELEDESLLEAGGPEVTSPHLEE